MCNPKEQCKTCGKFKGPSKKVKDLWLGCEGCGDWFHSDCEKINDAQYKMIMELGSAIRWQCKKCGEEKKDGKKENKTQMEEKNDAVQELKQAFSEMLDSRLKVIEEKIKRAIEIEMEQKIEKEVKERKEEMAEMKRKIEKIEKNWDKSTKEENKIKENEKKNYASNLRNQPIELRVQVQREMKEMRERQERRKNIIIRGLEEEITMDTVAEGMSWLQDKLEIIDDLNIVNCCRLGKKGGKCRLIKIDFKTEEHAQKIFDKRKTLMVAENGKYEKVFISADRTRAQREEQREWRNKRLERRKGHEKLEGEEKDKTKKGTDESTEELSV